MYFREIRVLTTPCFTLILLSFREIAFTRNLYSKALWLLLMRTTDWLSCEKPNRPPSEVTNSNSLDTSLPLSVYFVASPAFPCHHISSKQTNGSKCKVEKVAVHEHALTTNNFVDFFWPLIQCEMLCFVMFYGAAHHIVGMCRNYSFILLNPSKWLLSSRYSIFRIHHPAFRCSVNRGGSGSPILQRQRETHTCDGCQAQDLPTRLSDFRRF